VFSSNLKLDLETDPIKDQNLNGDPEGHIRRKKTPKSRQALRKKKTDRWLDFPNLESQPKGSQKS